MRIRYERRTDWAVDGYEVFAESPRTKRSERIGRIFKGHFSAPSYSTYWKFEAGDFYIPAIHGRLHRITRNHLADLKGEIEDAIFCALTSPREVGS